MLAHGVLWEPHRLLCGVCGQDGNGNATEERGKGTQGFGGQAECLWQAYGHAGRMGCFPCNGASRDHGGVHRQGRCLELSWWRRGTTE